MRYQVKQNDPPSPGTQVFDKQYQMTKYERWDTGLHIVEISSMFAVALIALFGENFRKFINRPKLNFNISRLDPHVKKIGLTATQGEKETDYYVQIRLEVTNAGNTPIQNLKAYTSLIYANQGATGKICRVAQLAHEPFEWHLSGSAEKNKVDIHPQTSRFLCIANVIESVLVQQSSPETSAAPVQSLSPSEFQILLRDENRGQPAYRVDQTTIIIPIIFMSDQHRIKTTKYVQIYWNKLNIRDFSTWPDLDFSVCLIDETEFKKMCRE